MRVYKNQRVHHVPGKGFEPNEHGWLAAFTVTVAGVDAEQMGGAAEELAAAVAGAYNLSLDRVLVHVGSDAAASPEAAAPPEPGPDAFDMEEGSISDASEWEELPDSDASGMEEQSDSEGAAAPPSGVEIQVLVMRQPVAEEGVAGAHGTAPGPDGGAEDAAQGGGELWERVKACAHESAAPLVFRAPLAGAVGPSATALGSSAVLSGSAGTSEASVEQPCLPGVRRVRSCEWEEEARVLRDAAKATWGALREGVDFLGQPFGERDAVVGVYGDELGAVVGRVEGGRREEVLRALPGKVAACCATGVGVENVAVRRVDREHPAYSSNPSAGWGLFVVDGGGLPTGAVLGEYVGAVSVLKDQESNPGEFELCLPLPLHPTRREDVVQLVVDPGTCRNAMAFANVHPEL